ncbi:hypothetical protein BKA61DRAFT_595482 [Leptodontidium sp. MPI-SDFR-AT-0119]|nr:hypothetical protein BKA61DRAFT_595482 [Leptodontidium sp. MPI-SDFR-AT-0119]
MSCALSSLLSIPIFHLLISALSHSLLSFRRFNPVFIFILFYIFEQDPSIELIIFRILNYRIGSNAIGFIIYESHLFPSIMRFSVVYVVRITFFRLRYMDVTTHFRLPCLSTKTSLLKKKR